MDWNTLDSFLLEHEGIIIIGLVGLYLAVLLAAWIWDRRRVSYWRVYLRRRRALRNWKPPVVDSYYPFHEPPPAGRFRPFYDWRGK